MSPLKQSNNIAARMGRWSASHWKTAVFGWLAFVVIAVAVGGAVGTKQIDQQDANVGQAHKADQILKQAGFQADPQTEIVLVQSKQLTIARPGLPGDGRGCDRHGAAVRGDHRTSARRSIRPRDQVSADGHTAHGRVRHARQADVADEADRPDHRPRPARSPGATRLLRRRGGLDQLRQGAERRVQRAARAGRRAARCR